VILTLAQGQRCLGTFTAMSPIPSFAWRGRCWLRPAIPRNSSKLAAGEMCTVPANRPHHVSGKGGGRCMFALLQGVGRFDFNLIGPSDLDD
jgi:hypothetical protein